MPHARWSLQQHLLGTQAILAGWRQPQHVRLAGAMHSVYATDAFDRALFAPHERETVRTLIGPRAERLVFLFGALDRRELFAALAIADEATAPLRLPSRNGGTPLDLTVLEAGELAVIHLANLADQSALPDGAPARWLARASQLAAWARARVDVVPPVFASGTATLEASAERRLIDAYAAPLTAQESSLRDAFADAPWPAEPAIRLGLGALARGDVDAAAAFGAHAETLLAQWGTAWDKRLSFARWQQLAELLAAAAAGDGAARAFRVERVQRALTDLPPLTLVAARLEAAGAFAAAAALPPRFAAYVARLRDDASLAAGNRYPGLIARPWHDPAAFPIVRDLEAEALVIAQECRTVQRELFHAESENITRLGHWDVAILFERGRRNDALAQRAPRTTAIVERHRTVRGPAGLAYFSRLAPGTHIAPHAGPTTMRLRCHLGLAIPPGCGLRVGGISGGWSENRCIVFDDSFIHEAWNDGDRERIVFIVDLWHPDLRDDEIALLEGLNRYIAASADNLAAYWAKNKAVRT